MATEYSVKTVNSTSADSTGNVSITVSGGTYTASNGLAMSGTDVQLGGTLTENTTITANAYSLTLNKNAGIGSLINLTNNSAENSIGCLSGNIISTGTNSATGISISANGTYAMGMEGISDSYIGIQARSTSGTALNAFSTSGVGATISSVGNNATVATSSFTPVSIISVDAGINYGTVQTALQVRKNVGNTFAQNGAGVAIDFSISTNSVSTFPIATSLISKWTNATTASRTSEFSITGVNNAVTNTIFTLSGNGVATFYNTIQLKGYTVATLPTGIIGMTAYVTDAASPTSLATVTGGGSTAVRVFYNGTNWIVQ